MRELPFEADRYWIDVWCDGFTCVPTIPGVKLSVAPKPDQLRFGARVTREEMNLPDKDLRALILFRAHDMARALLSAFADDGVRFTIRQKINSFQGVFIPFDISS